MEHADNKGLLKPLELESKPYRAVNEMTVEEVIGLPVFEAKLQECIDEVEDMRKDALKQAIKSKYKVKRDVTCGLRDRGLWNTIALRALYKKLLANSRDHDLSSNERTFVRAVGDQALHEAVRYLKTEERLHKKNNHGKEENKKADS